MMLSLYRICFLVTLLLSTLSENVLASVLAIDYGADWIKASLMKPGVPFDVLLNKDSKRKIQSTVAWKQKDRLFGSDAAAIVRPRNRLLSSATHVPSGRTVPSGFIIITEISPGGNRRLARSLLLQVHLYRRPRRNGARHSSSSPLGWHRMVC